MGLRNLPQENNSSSAPDILVEDRRWYFCHHHPQRLAARALVMTHRFLPADSAIVNPEFVFSTDQKVKMLNARFRGKNKPTNVLTFEPFSPGDKGSIILAYDTTRREAFEKGKAFKAHMAHLIVHGLLHLAGYDHHHPGEAKAMEMKETRILRQMGFADPWEKSGERSVS